MKDTASECPEASYLATDLEVVEGTSTTNCLEIDEQPDHSTDQCCWDFICLGD